METVRACIERHAESTPDNLILIAPDNGLSLSFAQLKAAADEWDGASAPVRVLDPASGTLVERDR